jgi:5-methylcytosine-specific restriction endonuclease McrBC regulatory subunit McrC
LLIVDAKYKNPLIEHHGDRFHNSDLYQAFAYAAALEREGVASLILVFFSLVAVLITTDHDPRRSRNSR